MRHNYLDYYIAVLGYPRSGKTIFITSFLNHLIREKIPGCKPIKLEDKTAKRFTYNINYLSSRLPFDQSNEDSVFPYIVDISKGTLNLKKYYKIQIGDFSGDNSAQISEGYRQWFHKSSSFLWAMQANAFIFVVDLAEVLAQYDDDFYCEKVSDGIFEACKRIEQSPLAGEKKLKDKPIILLFSKADLLSTFYESIGVKTQFQIRIQMLQSGFAKKALPETINIKKDLDPDLYALIQERFRDIIHFLNKKSKMYNTVFFSHFLTLNSFPLGIEKVANLILPK